MKKTFRFHFSPLVWILLSLTLLVSLCGIAINVYNLVILAPFDSAFRYVSFGILCLILAVFVVTVMTSSTYKIKKCKLYLKLGFIKSIFDLDKAVNITHFEDKNMLLLFFNNGEYTRIVISKENFLHFSESVREENSFIIFSCKDSKED